MPKIKKKSTIPNEVSKKRDQKKNHNKKVLDKTDGNSCVCKKLESIVEKLQSLSEKLAAESPCDSYDDFSKYISSLLRGLPQKTALNLKRKLVNDILEVVNAQGDDDPSFFSFTNKRYIPNAVSVSHQESTIPHSATTSQCATRDLSLLAEAEPSRESSRELRKSGIKRSPMPAAARTRAQKRKQSFNESNSKRIATEIEDCLPVDEPLPEEVNEASSSFRSLPAQDENVTLIDFEEGNELCEMKYDQEIVKDITFDLVKQEAPDPLGETNDIVEDIAQLFLCDVCLTQCPSREALTQHFQQEHPGSIERRKDINIVDIKNKEVQKWVDDSFELNEKEVCNTVAADADLEIVGSSAIEAIKQGDFNVDGNKAETNNCNDESPIKILGIQELDENCREEENVDNSSFHLELDDSGVSNDVAVDLDMEGVANLNSEGINQNDLTSSNDNGDNCNPIDGSYTNMNDVAAGSDMTAAASSEVINQNDLTRTNDKGVINKPTDGSQIKILGVQELGDKSRSIENTAARPLQQIVSIEELGVDDFDEEINTGSLLTRAGNKKKKMNCCLYCKKMFTCMKRHHTRIHRKEEDVIQFLKTCDRETRIKLMGTIINKGNYEYNMRMVANGQTNQLIPKKYPSKGRDIANRTSHVVCKSCYGTYSLKTASHHYKKCCADTGNIEEKRTRTSINYDPKNNIVLFYTPDRPEVSKELKEDVIKRMMKDRVSQVAQSDPLILTLGSKCYNGSKDEQQIRYVITKIRELSKILILMKERNKDIETFEYCISPQCFNDIIDIVKKLSKRIDGQTFIIGRIKRMGTSLKECASILKQTINEHVSLLPEEKIVRNKTVNGFIQLMNTKWKQEFCHKFDKSFRMKVSHISVVPSSDDIILVFKNITKNYKTLIKKLKDNPTTDNYCVLAKKCIVQLIILNRRKSDEISHALLEHYNEKSTIPQFDPTENCVNEFRILGTSCDENCLLTKPMIEAINALVGSRDLLKVSSKYLFSHPNSPECNEDKVFNGEAAVNEVRAHFQRLLKKPENFTFNSIINHSVSPRTLIETIVPEAHSDDVTMAFAFIAKSSEQLIKELEANPTPARYCVLAKRCIAHLIILNRCQHTKVTEVLLDGFNQIKKTENLPVDNDVQVYNIPAPYHEKSASLLLSNQMKLAIDTLVTSRGPLEITSKYLFADPSTSELNSEQVFNGEEVISELGQQLIFQLKVPDNFTASGLRYHTVNQEKLLGFTINGPKVVPVSEDVISSFIVLTNQYQHLTKGLKESPSSHKYCELAKLCIAHLIILNKCEPTEVTQTLLEHYERVRKVSVSQSVFSTDAVEVFDIPISETDSPPLLMSKPMKQAIDTLVVSRCQLMIDSKYLFAVPIAYFGEDRVFDAEQAISELKNMCIFELRQPDVFTAQTLRNHDVTQDLLLGARLNIGNELILSNETNQANNKAENPAETVAIKQNTIGESGSVDETKKADEKSLTENPVTFAFKENTIELSGSVGMLIKEGESDKVIENITSTEKHINKNSLQDEKPDNSQGNTFASKFARFCLPDLTSDSDSDDSSKIPIRRVRWSDEEKEVVYKYFGRHLLNRQNPGRQEINRVLQKEPVLKNRSLDQVNVYVNNIVTEKVKLTPHVVRRIKDKYS